jgi:hypothetical protein
MQLGWGLTGVRSTETECSPNVPRMFPECSLQAWSIETGLIILEIHEPDYVDNTDSSPLSAAGRPRQFFVLFSPLLAWGLSQLSF